jgi:hypothetical protein
LGGAPTVSGTGRQHDSNQTAIVFLATAAAIVGLGSHRAGLTPPNPAIGNRGYFADARQ